MSPPTDHGGLGFVVLRKIILWYPNGLPRIFVPEIFQLQRVSIVLRMAGDEQLVAVLGGHGIKPRLL